MLEQLPSRSEFVQFVREVGKAVVASVNAHGDPEAAFVSVAVAPDAALVFNSRADARKVANITAHPRLAVVVGGPSGACWQAEGDAEILAGADRDQTVAWYKEQIPWGRTTDDYVLIRVTPRWVRYHDIRPDSRCVAEGFWA